MHAKQRIRLLAASALGLAAWTSLGASLTSASCSVVGSPESSLVWKTIYAPTSELALVWPEGAASARLTVSVGGIIRSSETIADTTASTWPFAVSALPETTEAECVYDLTLEYLDAESAVVKTQTASLGLVRGTDGRRARFVRDGELSAKWPQNKSRSAVLPIPDGATTLTVDQRDPVEVSAPGWHYLKAGGKHELSMAVGSDSWLATVQMGLQGLFILVR